jgi:hypothetical protein
MLIDLTVRVELFHTANGTAFADLMIDGHRETWAIRLVRRQRGRHIETRWRGPICRRSDISPLRFDRSD